MFCQQSLEILEAIRPDSNDMLEPEFREAYVHMQECSQCFEVWGSRQKLDNSLSRVMLDVPVPETLRHRLEEALGITLAEPKPQTESEDRPETTVEISVRTRRTRRGLLLKMSAALTTALLVTFAAWLFWKPQPVQPLTLEDLVNATPLDTGKFETLADFDGSFDDDLPKIWKKSGGIVFDSPTKGFFLPGRNKDSRTHIAAFSRFEVKDRRGHTIVGYLLAIPKIELANAPQLTDFDPQQSGYVERAEGMFDSVAWSEGSFTYIAFVPAGHKALDAIQNALPRPML